MLNIDIMCFDSNGNQLEYLTQWDLDRTIKFDVTGYQVSGKVQVHFSNTNRSLALVVDGTVSGSTVTAKIPNEILREPHAVFAYIFVIASGERKTVAFATIPLRKRNKPSDYVYSDDIEILTLDNLIDEVRAITSQYKALDIDSKITRINTIIADYERGSVVVDGSITYAKLSADVKKKFTDVDAELGKKMDKSVYDPRNMGDTVGDVYGYAKAKADEVADDLGKYKQSNNTLVNTINQELTQARTIAVGNLMNGGYILHAQSLDAMLSAILDDSKSYTRARLADYKAFSVRIVESIDFNQAGEGQTFYLVPKEVGNGYDKYWYITDDITGESRWDSFGASSTIVVDALPANSDADPNADYILQTDSGCVYYKFIDGQWEVVAGSMAQVIAALPETGNSLTDYYVKNESGSYVHYRWIDNDFVAVGSDSYTKEEIDQKLANLPNLTSRVETLEGENSTLNTTVTQLGNKVTTMQNAMESQKPAKDYDISYDTDSGVLALTEDGEEKTTVIIKGGGGGSDIVASTMTMTPVTPNPYIELNGKNIVIDFDFQDVDADGFAVSATAYITVEGKTVATGIELTQGVNSIDITEYVSVGSKKVRIYAVDDYGSRRYKEWNVRVVDISITSSYNDRYTNAIGRNVSIPYTPVGNVVKTVHFLLDGEPIDYLETASTGTVLSYSLPAMPHGAYLFEMYITANVGGTYIETDHVYKDVIWYDEDAKLPIIGCVYRSDYYGTVNMRQYDTMPIIFNAFDPETTSPRYSIVVDGAVVDSGRLENSYNTYRYKGDTTGSHEVDIYVGDVVFTYGEDGKVSGVNEAKSRYAKTNVKFEISELGIDVSPVTGNLEIDFNPTGMSNNSANRIWTNGTYSMSVSSNFDWANGGYHSDENGDTYFLVKAGTTATFDYKMFDTTRTSTDIVENATAYGTEMKLVFMTENVQDAEATWFTNVGAISGDEETGTKMGIQLNVHDGWLKTNNASATDVTSGEGDEAETVAATNTYLYMPYSEEDIIELDINIDTIDKSNSSAKSFVMAYEDGVPSKAFVYDNSDNFYQASPKPIVIGSKYCDVRIYRMKIYSTSLSTENIMKNFIADSRDSSTMLERYDRNSIYYNSDRAEYTPYSSEGALDPEKIAKIVPNLKVLMLDTDHFTTSKKVFVKSTLRCIHAEGGDVYPGDPYYDNWFFENGYHSGRILARYT